MTIAGVRFSALLWFVGSLCALGAVLPMMSVLRSSFVGALLFSCYLQVTRVLGGLLVSGWTRRTHAKRPFGKGEGGAVDRIPVQAVWVLNHVTTLIGAEDIRGALALARWQAHQDAHMRAGHGWLATIGQSIGIFLVTWLFLTIGPLTSVIAILSWVLALMVAMSVFDRLLRVTFEAALGSASITGAPDVSTSIVPWRDIATNPPVCRWTAGVIHVDSVEAEGHG